MGNYTLDDYSEYLKEVNSNVANNVYNDKLKNILSKKDGLLEDYVKYYVLCKTTPDDNEYQNFFSTTKTNLTKLKGELIELLNTIESNTDNINAKIKKLDKLIQIEKTNNSKYKTNLGNLDTKMSASSQLISNYTEMYDTNYTSNWSVFLSIIVIWYTTKKIYFPPSKI